MRGATYLSALTLSLCALALAACGGKHEPARAHGDTLTIYASVPRQGPTARMADAVADGARLALADARGHAGGKRIRLVELDSSRPEGETWDPSVVQENAKRAADDPTAIAYIGELDEGASAISIPVTNDAGILQVSPGDGFTGLTRVEPGTSVATAPERYYPSGRRNFLRLVPNDYLQAGTLAGWARARGARRIATVQDERLFGRELAAQTRYVAAKRLGMTVVDGVEAGNDPTAYPQLAKRLAGEHPDAVIYTGLGDAPAGTLLAAIGRALPGVPLYAGSGLATATPQPSDGTALGAIKPALAPSAYGRRARRLLARLSRQRGAPVAAEALYGYEAMRVVLDALDTAAPASDDRDAVVRAALAPRLRRSPLGDYRVLRSGDVSTRRFGSYRRTGASGLSYLGPRVAPAQVR
jgi:branched-chain amino acid transport system substrate-binding protein